MESLKYGAEERGALLPKNWSPEDTDLLEAERGQYTISQFQLRLCKTSIILKQLNLRCKAQENEWQIITKNGATI